MRCSRESNNCKSAIYFEAAAIDSGLIERYPQLLAMFIGGHNNDGISFIYRRHDNSTRSLNKGAIMIVRTEQSELSDLKDCQERRINSIKNGDVRLDTVSDAEAGLLVLRKTRSELKSDL